ncbi:carbohydrate ABC transporter permease [Sediminispirochaeta bajacaliforniensis]|uniref:carbohydrate ABC transporter permease n=1 Tax=Sediminispirochaeta bajacaliforniensis TaxID=148 RepID=UPI000362E347|nr:sugar ABC transporter permease [Sediminispirochaeta bajacaliforniensis]
MRKHKRSLTGYWFILPAAVLVVLYFFIPVILTLGISLTNMSSVTGFSNWSWTGLANYIKILKHPDSGSNFATTLIYVACTLSFFNVGMGLLVAILAHHMPKRLGEIFRSLWLLPRITPPVVYVLMWTMLAADAPYGVINQLFRIPFGLSTSNWLPEYAMLFAVLVNGYIGASFGMILFSSAIEAIPNDIMVSSLVDGASFFNRARYIILPQLKWPLLFVTTYQTLSLLTSFESILILTDGNFGTEVWALWSYHKALNNYYGNFQYGFGAALSAVLVFVGVIFAIIYLKYFKFNDLVKEPLIDEL